MVVRGEQFHLDTHSPVTHAHNDLKMEEQNIICGALELHKKTVDEVMTKLDDVYMLSVETILDFNTINEIMQQGYSRVPVYEGERTNIITVLFIKDLAYIDPDDNTPLKTLCQFYQNPANFVFVDTTLDVMFKDFKEGNKGHMAFVQCVNNERSDCDPFYEVLGLVTLEDVIEELIQEEIVDETDVFMDNRTRRRRQVIGRPDFTEFSHPSNQTNHKRVQISPQMQVAALQYLRTSVEPFKEGQLSEAIVKKLLNQDVIHNIKFRNKEQSKTDISTYIYTQGKPIDYFVLILEGHVEVTIGKENLTFESGPFTYFGLVALSHVQPIGESPSASTQLSKGSMLGSVQSLDSTKFTFTPDYSVRAVTEVMYLRVRRTHFIAARRAYLLEQVQKEPHGEEHFEKEIAKMLIEDDGPSSPAWENTPLTAPSSKNSGLANGCSGRAYEENTNLEMTLHNILNNQSSTTSASPTNPAGSETQDSNSASPPPASHHTGRGVRQDSSVIDMDDLPRSVSELKMVSPQNDKRMKRMHKDPTTTDNISGAANNNKDNNKEPTTTAAADNISLTNDLSTSSVEDNGSQEVGGQGDHLEPDLTDYKESNLDADAPTTATTTTTPPPPPPEQHNSHHTSFS
ncbi:hypothetical protein Pmani_033418 [Petrolisthes manimaculis]|uniref:Cyclic nucleotide-binding domain-containing protein n=1 Tax=Petrolisthes manimaculis TaxID=1843537 RepID=A0AAE1TSN9_9EUCA|nr:hypothetical protein Pmani_033418 [Petrolisthes manimaculis]